MSVLKKRILLIASVAFILIACFTISYFSVTGYLRYKNRPKAGSVEEGGIQEAGVQAKDIISENTVINIIKRYIVENKNIYSENDESAADSSYIGMNRLQLSEHCKSQGYTLIDFSTKKVTLVRDMSGWPPGRYVVKDNDNKVAIYSVGKDGSLSLKEKTEISMDLIPDGDRESIALGKIYETIESAREYVEYSLDS